MYFAVPMCLLVEFVFWKLDSEISSGFSGESKAVTEVGNGERVNGRNTERVEESSANEDVVSFNVQQEIALYWRVTETGAVTTRSGDLVTTRVTLQVKHSLIYLV